MSRDGALSYLEPLEATSRGVAVLDALADMIDRAGLKVGDRLPPEVKLAASLGVGRSTMREALNRWEGLGIIRRRRGDGTYLTAQVQPAHGPLPTMIRLEGEALLRLLEVRRVIETGTVRRAAARASAPQRAEISRLCDLLLAVVADGLPYREADAAFHAAICDATGNPMFGQLLTGLDAALERSKESPFSRSAFGLGSFPQHRDLSDAIVAGDADAAAAAINGILDTVEAEIRDIIANGPQPARP
jgi:DNA-binding FadR family transcriptional regulator